MTDGIDVAGQTRPGDRIAWSGAAMEPVDLLGILESQLDDIAADCSVLFNVSITRAIDETRLAGKARITALGGSVTNTRFQAIGALDVIPVNYSMLPGLVAGGRLAVDVVLLQLTTDGAHYNLSLMVDHLADAVPKARVVVAEVNDQLPVTFGETTIDAADVDATITVSRPPLEVPSRPAQALEREISAHVNRLINDGDTLQVGLGSLPDAVLEGLVGKKDLGVHSGTIGDRIVELAETGAITNRRKPVDTGKIITGTILGTDRLYRWAHRNPLLELRSPRYTHDNHVLGEIPNLVGVNSALEVDLTGQINAETVADRHVGMIGGQCDFMRGCLRSPGGRGIIVMQSTARRGTVSRIVPRIAGGIVTTARSDADIVVTEYGIAELRGRPVSERADQLIAIAHPDFRRELREAADAGLM